MRSATIFRICLWAVAMAGCKNSCKPKNTCKPDSVEWEVRLALGASETINPNGEGTPLPTALRVYQLRGDIATEDLDFDTVWTSEKAQDLGEAFLSVEELTVYPDRAEQRMLPLEEDATHMVATGLFREPAGNTWWTIFEIPRRHPEVVCSKAPETKVYPDPCFFVYVDRNALSGGPTPPPGFVPDQSMQCAPVGVVPTPPEKKRRRWRDRNKQELDDPLRSKEIDKKVPKSPQTPQSPQTPNPQLPQTPQTPQTPNPQVPSKPQGPTAPKLPGK